MSPIAYILAPFVLVASLLALYLAVSLLRGEPTRPLALFASPRTGLAAEAETILDILEFGGGEGKEKDELVERLREIMEERGEGPRWERIAGRAHPFLKEGEVQ